MNSSYQEYIHYALQCRAQADLSKDRMDKDNWEALAMHWTKLAKLNKEADTAGR